jgi:uncharacterized coiled-coil protein SlyX
MTTSHKPDDSFEQMFLRLWEEKPLLAWQHAAKENAFDLSLRLKAEIEKPLLADIQRLKNKLKESGRYKLREELSALKEELRLTEEESANAMHRANVTWQELSAAQERINGNIAFAEIRQQLCENQEKRIDELTQELSTHQSALETCREAISALISVLWPLEPATTDDGCYTDDLVEVKARQALSTIANIGKGIEGGTE